MEPLQTGLSYVIFWQGRRKTTGEGRAGKDGVLRNETWENTKHSGVEGAVPDGWRGQPVVLQE